MDEAKLEQFMGTMIGHMTGAMACYGVWLGDELGLYRALAGAGPLTAAEVAARAGVNQRLTEEWLRGQAASGLLGFDPGPDPAGATFTLSEEAALALAEEDSPAFVARAMQSLGSFFTDIDKVVTAFRGDGGLAWGDHHPCLYSGTEWLFRTGYRTFLATEWIPAMEGVADALAAGAAIADVGCGHGASSIVLAQAFPASRVAGFDLHEPSIRTAAKRAAEAGVADRIDFDTASAKEYGGRYDLICFFDCLHDMGDPVGIAAYAKEHLNDGGSLLLVEPFALDGAANVTDNPMAGLMYHASAGLCTPTSLSQEVGLGLGNSAGPARLRELLAEAGYSRFDVVASTPMNIVVQVRV